MKYKKAEMILPDDLVKEIQNIFKVSIYMFLLKQKREKNGEKIQEVGCI